MWSEADSTGEEGAEGNVEDVAVEGGDVVVSAEVAEERRRVLGTLAEEVLREAEAVLFIFATTKNCKTGEER